MTDGLLIFPTGREVVEDPFMVAVLLLDVFHQRLAHEFQTLRQAATAGHHQRHGVFYMVVSLGKKPGIASQVEPPLADSLNNGRTGYVCASLCSFGLQSIKKCHERSSRQV